MHTTNADEAAQKIRIPFCCFLLHFSNSALIMSKRDNKSNLVYGPSSRISVCHILICHILKPHIHLLIYLPQILKTDYSLDHRQTLVYSLEYSQCIFWNMERLYSEIKTDGYLEYSRLYFRIQIIDCNRFVLQKDFSLFIYYNLNCRKIIVQTIDRS